MLSTTHKNLIVSLLISIVLTIAFGVIYVIYPIVAVIVSAQLNRSGSDVNMAAGFGPRLNTMSLLTFVLLVTPAIFTFCFLLFERRSAQRRLGTT